MEITYRKNESGVVINTNKTGYKQARIAKKNRELEKKRLENLENEVKDLKDNIQLILNLLQEK
jgi:hypothetical protein